ncbi:MAG: ABC transporter permease [Calditrichaeota bacterium]|nr:ABC transporter permease [Calditrichota bacterium]RQW07629.1 MAG: ABC transporter permease [Calditrichota bacterium]
MQFFMLIREFFQDIKSQKTRAFLTTIAISWGILAVSLLMAFGEGLAFRMKEGMLNAGDRIIRVYGGQTTKKWEGLPVGRRVWLREEDCKVIEQNIPQVEVAIPGLNRNVRLKVGEKIASTHMEGVYPEFEFLRRTFHGAGGRFLNNKDVKERKRVVFLGGVIAQELFGKPDPYGEIVEIDGVPFKVVGTMPKKLQTSMNNGPDDRRAIVPFTTFKSIYGDKYLDEMIVKPVRPQDGKYVEEEIRRVLGKKYQFDPTDERATPMWNFIVMEKEGEKVFRGINIFLAVIGAMTLIIAGVGVANIMFVVAKERTREIGIKRAVGAKKRTIVFQFIFESLLIAFIGGVLGLLVSIGIIKLMWMIPSQEGPMEFLGRPLLSASVIWGSIFLLTLIGLLAGLFPARKAANVDPVEALRYE